MAYLRQQVKQLIKAQATDVMKGNLIAFGSLFLFHVFSHSSFHQEMEIEQLKALVPPHALQLDIFHPYKFQEAEHPDAFFIPFLWRIMVSHAVILLLL